MFAGELQIVIKHADVFGTRFMIPVLTTSASYPIIVKFRVIYRTKDNTTNVTFPFQVSSHGGSDGLNVLDMVDSLE